MVIFVLPTLNSRSTTPFDRQIIVFCTLQAWRWTRILKTHSVVLFFHALRLGPYMRRSCLRKLPHGHRWSHAAWQIIKTRTPPKTKGKTQIPQPDLRLTIQKTAQQTVKGARAQQKQPQKICQGHSGKNPLCRN